MAQKGRRGFKAPANYEPGRKPSGRKFHGGGRPGAAEPGRGGKSAAADSQRDRGDDGRRGPGERRGAGERQSGERRGAGERHGAGDQRAQRDPRDQRAERQAPRGQRPQAARGDDRLADRERRAPEAPLARLDAKVTTAADAAGKTFADLGLGGNIVRVLGELGAEQPFPIQVATIPDTIAGRDILGRARTGSGKTIAFGAALVERMLKLKASGAFGAKPGGKAPRAQRGVRVKQTQNRNPRALILAPTRELALQIDRTIQPIARSVGFYTAQMVGGIPIDPQIHALERGVDIVIGTPGRVQDLVTRRKLDLREVLITVLDEADHMCDLGFLEPVQQVLRQTEREGQRLLFSATLDSGVSELVREFLKDPAVHEAEAETDGKIRHRVHVVQRDHKDQALITLAKTPGRVLVFCRTRAYAEQVTELLGEAGLNVVSLHGDLSQSRRERNLAQFASGKKQVLVATDVAARGIHVDDVDLVIQADPPNDYKTYLHRAGRTGRAGRDGLVVTVISRVREQRTREMFEHAGVTPETFSDWVPKGAGGSRKSAPGGARKAAPGGTRKSGGAGRGR
ncbi:DEAD/DEAH box helicase [Leucobacter luti]|uniref:Superfamily II DNA/RNA helicase n=1 Tax=Leucobacter luti TaxID=340320 RepID=A0A4Q7TYB7_9MICO|nr:DEAD/DEAH box helicase [Leucobacter luti]RZT66196.1 superfamily II DNA/RNA helicase [Leucobacter luti]